MLHDPPALSGHATPLGFAHGTHGDLDALYAQFHLEGSI